MSTACPKCGKDALVPLGGPIPMSPTLEHCMKTPGSWFRDDSSYYYHEAVFLGPFFCTECDYGKKPKVRTVTNGVSFSY
jgi:hypothetical protein